MHVEYRSFGGGKLPVSLLGFGVMRLPVIGDNPAAIDEPKALEMIDYAYQNGVNYFDTAYIYHEQASEGFIGKAIARYPRDKVYLATKMPPWNLEEQEDVARIFNEQLSRCGVDYFDFYLMHSITRATMPVFEKFGVYEFLREQQKLGKIRHLGFSLHDDEVVFTRALDQWPVEFVQLQINYLDWESMNAKGLYEIAASRGIPVVVMEPVRGGALAALPPKCAQVLGEVSPSRSVASWGMRFAGALPGVMTVLSGMSTIEQIADNLASYTDFAPLSEAEREALDKVIAIYRQNAPAPCTACRYCMPCPVGVNIPAGFGAYNFCKNTGNTEFFKIEYSNIGDGSRPDDCTGCGVCLEKCPQRLDIPEWMNKIAQARTDLPGW